MTPITIPNDKFTYTARVREDGTAVLELNQVRAMAILAKYAESCGFMRYKIAPDIRGVGYILDTLIGTAEPYYVTLNGKRPPRERTKQIMHDAGYIKLKYYFAIEGVKKPYYCNLRLHILLSLLDPYMREMYKEVSRECVMTEGLSYKKLSVCVNHMALGKAYNWAYAREWTRQASNIIHGKKAGVAYENGAEAFHDYLDIEENDAEYIHCSTNPKKDFQLASVLSASYETIPWYFGDFFKCGINDVMINGVPAAEHYSRLLHMERLHENCAFVNVYTKDGWIVPIGIRGRTIWHILSEMYSVDTVNIVRVHKRRS